MCFQPNQLQLHSLFFPPLLSLFLTINLIFTLSSFTSQWKPKTTKRIEWVWMNSMNEVWLRRWPLAHNPLQANPCSASKREERVKWIHPHGSRQRKQTPNSAQLHLIYCFACCLREFIDYYGVESDFHLNFHGNEIQWKEDGMESKRRWAPLGWFALLLLSLFAQLFFSFISSMKAKERASWERRKKATNTRHPTNFFFIRGPTQKKRSVVAG